MCAVQTEKKKPEGPDLATVVRKYNEVSKQLYAIEKIVEPQIRTAVRLEVRHCLHDMASQPALQTLTGPQALRYAATMLV